MKNDVECCVWIRAKELVKNCKPVHISSMLSKLRTGQGLINGSGELFLLHLTYPSEER